METKNFSTIQETEVELWMRIKWSAWFDFIST